MRTTDAPRPSTPDAAATVDLDVSWLVPPDLCALDALARLQVAASRCGRSLQLHGASAGLPDLLVFVGLGDVLHLCTCCDPCEGESGPGDGT